MRSPSERWNEIQQLAIGMARALLLAFLLCGACAVAQKAPPSPSRRWHSTGELGLKVEGGFLPSPGFPPDSSTNYSLGELIDLAETHNVETRLAWERARAQAATLGLARSDVNYRSSLDTAHDRRLRQSFLPLKPEYQCYGCLQEFAVTERREGVEKLLVGQSGRQSFVENGVEVLVEQ